MGMLLTLLVLAITKPKKTRASPYMRHLDYIKLLHMPKELLESCAQEPEVKCDLKLKDGIIFHFWVIFIFVGLNVKMGGTYGHS